MCPPPGGSGGGEPGTEDTLTLKEAHLKRWVENKWGLGLFLAFNALAPPSSPHPPSHTPNAPGVVEAHCCFIARLSAISASGFCSHSAFRQELPPLPFGFLPTSRLTSSTKCSLIPPSAEPPQPGASGLLLPLSGEWPWNSSCFLSFHTQEATCSPPICPRAEPSTGLAQAAQTCFPLVFAELALGLQHLVQMPPPIPRETFPDSLDWGHGHPLGTLSHSHASLCYSFDTTVSVPPVVGSLYGAGLGRYYLGPRTNPDLNTRCQ